jgi:hypothetical protein
VAGIPAAGVPVADAAAGADELADLPFAEPLAPAEDLPTFGAVDDEVSVGPDALVPPEAAPLGAALVGAAPALEVDAPGEVVLGVIAEVFTPGSRSSGRGTLRVGAAGVGAGVGGVCCAKAQGDTARRPMMSHRGVLSCMIILLLSEAEPPPGADQQVSGPVQRPSHQMRRRHRLRQPEPPKDASTAACPYGPAILRSNR